MSKKLQPLRGDCDVGRFETVISCLQSGVYARQSIGVQEEKKNCTINKSEMFFFIFVILLKCVFSVYFIMYIMLVQQYMHIIDTYLYIGAVCVDIFYW